MKVNNFDCNGKPIEDISKVVLPDELSRFVYNVFASVRGRKEQEISSRNQQP
ncbi:hypothetical protein P7H46_03450 [Enterococcus pseudoavium]|uniref:Uncharacterized protein n=2 Tax=Enterococcus pseudoavium TaxID=44007 RepID=A0ABU3FFS8_9ENTE|nr:hypothetical protein [Enterococcus dongliensis]MDT2604817.1 hypothetical protein [Enterococcus dongliensis]MDT2769894.1 hypothetical protein [Enterococcus pseudoavium]